MGTLHLTASQPEERGLWAKCGGSVAGGPLSSPSGHPLLMGRMAPTVQGVIAAGGVDGADLRVRPVPVISPAVFTTFWRSALRAGSTENGLRPRKRPQSQHLSRVQIAIGYSDRNMTRYIHINTCIVVCVPRKDGLENGKEKETEISWYCCFTVSMVFSPLSLFYFLFLVSRPFRCAMISSPVSRCQSCPAVFSPVFE